ncbi:MAG: mRNA surveillance protein Pelota, partial [Candidatus Hydrothermarchaeota archaeon]
FVRQKKGECDELIEKAERLRSKVIIVSTEHEAGEKLQSIGGVAALLRFEV